MTARNRQEEHLSEAQLNELVDGTMQPDEAALARSHLAGCSECEQRYQALFATVAALQQAPSLMPRRSFQLTPEQARIPDKEPSRIDRFVQRLVPGMPVIRAATLAVALLLVTVSALDVITNRDGATDQVVTTQMREQAPSESSSGEGGAQEAAQPAQAVATEPGMLGAASDSEPASEPQESESAADGAAPAVAPAPAVASPESEKAEVAEASPAPTASPSPVSASESSTGVSISPWRIAELALLLLLLWLVVSWVGRSRVEHEEDPGTQ